MRKYKYSDELVNRVKEFLVNIEWNYSFDEDTGVFDFGFRVKSIIQKIHYIVNVHDHEIVVYGLCPICVDHTDANKMVQMAEFICRVNYGLKNGCFEIDLNDGSISFKIYIDCVDVVPSAKVIKNSIYCTEAMYRRYAAGILDIIFSGCTAKEAFAKCKSKSSKAELYSMIAEAFSDDMDEEIRVTMFDRKQEGGAA